MVVFKRIIIILTAFLLIYSASAIVHEEYHENFCLKYHYEILERKIDSVTCNIPFNAPESFYLLNGYNELLIQVFFFISLWISFLLIYLEIN